MGSATSPAKPWAGSLRAVLLGAVLLSLVFAADAAAAETTIDSGPSGTTTDNTPTFGFSSDEPGSTFECRLDAAPFEACSGPGGTHTTPTLSDGPYTFEVRAIDSASDPDPTPATREFTVDTTGPETTITKRPSAKIMTKAKAARVAVSFTSEAGATFRCRLNKAKYRPCDSPYRVKAKRKKGKRHRISIQATDPAGNVGDAAAVEFRVLPKLSARLARATVTRAIKRHGFSNRVVRALRIKCRRRSSTAVACRFSARFPGYRLRGRGKVTLRGGVSYRFLVKAQGLRFALTDENER